MAEPTIRARLRAGPWPYVLAVWAGSRVFFLVVGGLGHAFIRQASPGGFPREPPGTLDYWAHWDGGWYAAIAKDGYFNPPSTGFFPMYPMTLRAVAHLPGGYALWGVVLSVAALLFALFFVHDLGEVLFDLRTARIATAALALFPSALFLNAVYTEAFFLAFSAGAIWALRVRRDFQLACLLAFLAMLTRNVGVFLLVPILVEWWRRRRELGVRHLAWVGLAAAGLGAYMLYLWRGLGDPLHFAVAQRETWGRTLTNPVSTLHKAWTTGLAGSKYALHPHAIFGTTSPEPSFKAADTFNLVLFALLVVLLVAGLRMLPFDLWLYSFLVMLLPILTPSFLWALTSFNRYLLAAFPLFLVLGKLLARVRFLPAVWLAASAALGVYLTLLFVTWRWVA